MASRFLQLLCAVLVGSIACHSQTTSQSNTPVSKAKPLILEKNEGELRTRRTPAEGSSMKMSSPASQFMLKVSPKNNGSQHLVLGTEDIAPGGRIRPHRHLDQDEIVLILTGVAHVELGSEQHDVHAGGLVFIPANTRIAIQNTGSDPASIVFLFSAPGFEDYMRCTSVEAGQPAPPITVDELRRCAHGGHVVYEDLEPQAIRK